jgi:hypothetical protein
MTNIMDDYEKDLEVLMLVCVFNTIFLTGSQGCVGYRLHEYMATYITQQGGGFQSQRPCPTVHRVRECGSSEGSPRREPSPVVPSCIFKPRCAGLAPRSVEYPGDCLSNTETHEGAVLFPQQLFRNT